MNLNSTFTENQGVGGSNPPLGTNEEGSGCKDERPIQWIGRLWVWQRPAITWQSLSVIFRVTCRLPDVVRKPGVEVGPAVDHPVAQAWRTVARRLVCAWSLVLPGSAPDGERLP